MKVQGSTIDLHDVDASNDHLPQRELFTLPQLESHARSLAQSHQINLRKRGNKLLLRLRENESILLQTYNLISGAAVRRQRVLPASEWLLDNFYLIERQIGAVRRHLPRGYSRQLPRLLNGPYAGFPRVYSIAFELISHVDGKIDAASVQNFINAYQSVVDLRLGELWAIPIMLRLGIVESLRHVATRIADSQAERNAAEEWAAQFFKAAEHKLTDVILILADLTRENIRMSSTFVAELSRQLQGQNQNFAIAYAWIEQRLAERGTTREEIVHEENQREASDQISIGNCIESLRALDAIDWRAFVEASSKVEQILCGDPLGAYPRMDFATRDRYRHIVEREARRFNAGEPEVAEAAVACAKQAQEYKRHVGYYLIDDGIRELEARIGGRPPVRLAIARGLRSRALGLYCGAILAVTAVFTWLAAPSASSALPHAAFWILFLPLAAAASQFAVSLVNWLSTRIVKPTRLARLDFAKGIPGEHKTVVAAPCMLSSISGIDDQLEKLEIRYLGNRDANLSFAMLSDFLDAGSESTAADNEFVDYAAHGIEALNQRYSDGKHGIFHLFHRPRRWNAKEGRWIGYERKRGKLAEFNAFLLTGKTERFMRVVADPAALSNVKYVITVDADTQLPSGSAHKLIGTLAHPLNRPVYDKAKGHVTRGYGILQPQAATTLPSAQRSWFSRTCGGEPGIDPYTQVISDVYQDLFGEGSFIGKGIYDLHGFEQALQGRMPENRILSHDLIEGSYARCGLVTDVQLFEDFPSRYLADTARRHRWMRGDWQIARWLRAVVPGPGNTVQRNPISKKSQWKIFDNLRRSLIPIAVAVALPGGWLLAPNPLTWTLTILLTLFLPQLLDFVTGILSIDTGSSVAHRIQTVVRRAGTDICRALLNISFLPYEAWLSADAITRTLYRLTFSGKRLLEWTTSSEAEQSVSTSFKAIVKTMWQGPLLTTGLVAAALLSHRILPEIAAPILTLWIFSPVTARWISTKLKRADTQLAEPDVLFLRRLSRQIWAFFERFVGTDDNWLPPDNFQENPIGVIAHRTSPTNMGMSLLANLSAYDLGFITLREAVRRCQLSLTSMQGLERRRGHFYNWYDTIKLKALPPLYISTVDSGNLAGHLLTLQRGLLEFCDKPIASPQNLEGISDTLEVLRTRLEVRKYETAARNAIVLCLKMRLALTDFRSLHGVTEDCKTLGNDPLIIADAEMREWVSALNYQLSDLQDSLLHFAPWLIENPGATPQTLRDIAGAAALAGESDRTEFAYRAQQAIHEIEGLAQTCESMAAAMDFSFLYVPGKKLFSIGFNVADYLVDASCYDLLASEARLASFVAIAEGQVEQEHWFALGRQITSAAGTPTLVSWSGSMFEYLMPLLVMPNYTGTILDQTYEAVVKRQIAYGKERGAPWGISESGYNLTDAHLNYQYRAFGVPGLGLQRGLEHELVIAPYASVMALMVAPAAACRNLHRLYAEKRAGAYGLYEAVDYTPSRLPPGQKSVTIKSYMAHHQGMSLLALDYLLKNQPMQRRFSSAPVFKVADLLLQERAPKTVNLIVLHPADVNEAQQKNADQHCALRIVADPSATIPEVHLLSNGRYHVLVDAAGSGYSRWKDLAVTCWREDAARDAYGLFCYVRDLESGALWSTSFQPAVAQARKYEAIFSEGRVEFRRSDNDIEIHTEICVSAEDDVEIRRMRLTNTSNVVRAIELTSYGEVVLAASAADAAHPAFNKLFIETSIDAQREAILCTRRPRVSGEKPPVLFHSLHVRNLETASATFETSRNEFIGRMRALDDPAAFDSRKLSGSQGSVLDPIVSIRRTVLLKPRETAIADLICGISESAQETGQLIEKYRDQRLADRVFNMAWTHSQVALRQLNCSEQDAQLFARLAGGIVFASQFRRASPAVLAKNRRGQSGLWAYGISGDLPIIVLRISDVANIEIARQCLKAHSFWRMKGLNVDLVVTVDDPSAYRQALYDQIIGMIAAGSLVDFLDKPGGIFVRRAEQISEEDRILLQTVARIVLTDSDGSFKDQVEKRIRAEVSIPQLRPAARKSALTADRVDSIAAGSLTNFNGLGGFSADGAEYVMLLDKGVTTPAPWANVIANPTFGSVVSESGSAYTWLENSHEYRLTPWSNDPVSDPSGEALYLRDEDTGQYWSPTPAPAGGPSRYIVRHGFGYSVYETCVDGIVSELTVYVAIDAPVKFMSLKLNNRSNRVRRLSAWAYFEWVMAELRSRSQLHVTTEIDSRSGAILARNPYSSDFPGRIAFVASTRRPGSCCGDRMEFIGRNGSLRQPASLKRTRLSGKVGSGLDPCAAIQSSVILTQGESAEIVFELGIGQDVSDVQNLLGRFNHLAGAQQALATVRNFWTETLSAVRVETPDQRVDLMANGWLLYQTLACRMWARTGFYQSGGAFGFRDQLQDSLALLYSHPALVRQHLLLAARHQFREGDVQHWWHSPSGRGVRTHFSDDFLWLPFAVCQYVKVTGDARILDESTAYVEGRPVNSDEEAYYDLPMKSGESGTLYNHCIRAIEHGLKFGAHGLPLMGCGDWNDGMNRVGAGGKGESVWLAFFLYDVLKQFAGLARGKGDDASSERCAQEAERLKGNIAANAWDGNWYLRAYFDDGRPLGSASNDECQIDSLPQSWSVLSEAGDPARSSMAMQCVDQRLVRRDEHLIKLFDPPFNHSDLDPGYIKGYAPGVRENGGQYTHAALWVIMAFAKLGKADAAWELLSIINPIGHGATPQDIQTYKVEPYVIAADIYSVAPHIGRGGWTWYTGSAGWMYRTIVESLLGFRVENDVLRIQPCIPKHWPHYKLWYTFQDTVWRITVVQDDAVTDAEYVVDGQPASDAIKLTNDRNDHHVIVKVRATDPVLMPLPQEVHAQ